VTGEKDEIRMSAEALRDVYGAMETNDDSDGRGDVVRGKSGGFARHSWRDEGNVTGGWLGWGESGE